MMNNRHSKIRILFVAGVVFLAATVFCSWWVAWPRQVASNVSSLLNSRRFEDVMPMLATEHDRRFLEALAYIAKDAPSPTPAFTTTPRDRTWSDLLHARQSFILGYHFEILVDRGVVSFPGSEESPLDIEFIKELEAIDPDAL